MKWINKTALLFMLLALTVKGYAQADIDTLEVYFRQGYSTWDAAFKENGQRMEKFIERIKKLQEKSDEYKILRIHYLAGASPEGSVAGNKRLSQRRAATVTEQLHRHLTFTDSLIVLDTPGEDWQGLIDLVKKSDMPQRDETLEMLQEKLECLQRGEISSEQCKREVMAFKGGAPWQYMYKHFFPKLRRFSVTVFIGIQLPEELETVEPLEPQPEEAYDLPFAPIPDQPEDNTWKRHLYVKSNGIGWLMLIGNAAVEVDLAPHWSLTVPVYYSAFNYFTSDLKFRTLCTQPEARYWFNRDNNGWFVGGHLGVGWYNYAKNGSYRYQDHNRRTPLWGGGFSGGYRKAISKNQRWFLEATLGAGCYKLHYDVFHNEINGKLIETKKRTFYGIDNAAVTIAYRFNLKGGKK